jgi:hypothetical protein
MQAQAPATPPFGSLDVPDVSASANPGEMIYEFLVHREQQIRDVH